jgi:hypothetical protein
MLPAILTTFRRIGVGTCYEEAGVDEEASKYNTSHMWLRDTIEFYFNKVVMTI